MLIMGALVFIGIGIAFSYYEYENKSVDPRIVEAREMYRNYDAYAEKNDFSAVLSLLDSIEVIYQNIMHYQGSYELGVICNNRSATFLTMAIHFNPGSISHDGVSILTKDSLLILGEAEGKESIRLYEQWLSSFQGKNKDQIKAMIEDQFMLGLEDYPDTKQQRFLKKRIAEIEEAQLETPRRLSVSYTNIGIVKRHQQRYEDAVSYYKKALALWDRNLAAENNLNTLLGLPLKKRSALEKIFPPDKKD